MSRSRQVDRSPCKCKFTIPQNRSNRNDDCPLCRYNSNSSYNKRNVRNWNRLKHALEDMYGSNSLTNACRDCLETSEMESICICKFPLRSASSTTLDSTLESTSSSEEICSTTTTSSTSTITEPCKSCNPPRTRPCHCFSELSSDTSTTSVKPAPDTTSEKQHTTAITLSIDLTPQDSPTQQKPQSSDLPSTVHPSLDFSSNYPEEIQEQKPKDTVVPPSCLQDPQPKKQKKICFALRATKESQCGEDNCDEEENVPTYVTMYSETHYKPRSSPPNRPPPPIPSQESFAPPCPPRPKLNGKKVNKAKSNLTPPMSIRSVENMIKNLKPSSDCRVCCYRNETSDDEVCSRKRTLILVSLFLFFVWFFNKKLSCCTKSSFIF